MSDNKLHVISIRLNGNNYYYWSYVMEKFIVDKGMWEHVVGITLPPKGTKKDDYAATLLKWQ